MNFFKRLIDMRRPNTNGIEDTSRPARAASSAPEGAALASGSEICGPPRSDSPIVMVQKGETMMIMDRMSYEYREGMRPGVNPSQAELQEMLGKVSRLRA